MKEYFLEQIDFEHWANLKVIEAYKTVENPEPRATELVSHILRAKLLWFSRIIDGEPNEKPWDLIPDEQLVEFEEKNYQLWKNWISDNTNEGLNSELFLQTPRGPIKYYARQILNQLNLHAAYHRGQIIVLLKPRLKYIPKLDYLVYAAEINKKNA